MLERIAGQTRSLRSKNPSIRVPGSIIMEGTEFDAVNVIGILNDTYAADTSFIFDCLIVNSKVTVGCSPKLAEGIRMTVPATISV